MRFVTPSYRARLDGLSFLIFGGLAALPLVLGYALGGVEWAVFFLLLVVGLGLFRPGNRGPFPGTLPLVSSEAPGLFTLIESLAERAGLKSVPEVNIVPGGQINAAATLRGNRPVLIVTEALLANLDARRISAVLAHETAHLAHRDLLVFRLAGTLQAATTVLGFVTILLALFAVAIDPASAVLWAVIAAVAPAAARFLVAALSRTREFAADLGAARLTGDPGALADALDIIEYRPRTLWDWIAGRRAPVPDQASDAFRTHPSTRERIRRLDLLARLISGG
jgi:heat shock protein HtpX